ncbi:MAG: ATP-binding cassette domain-containing protein [Proteobacteria bacterium]|nr:ATP-binding cassette domain-containing protein [Pseudomonadota bacterium]MDE3208951.1 ATP-binding cassette domain-containing protein [Pseudomonadota bacterium]
MIRFNQVCKTYPGKLEAIRDLSLEIQSGEAVLLTGRSGSGKTTLIKMICALEMPTSGQILVNNQDISRIKKGHIPYLRQNIGLVFQEQKILYDHTVLSNVSLPLHISGHSRSETAQRAKAALEHVGLLHREKANPLTLSGGERQRMCIARAIVNRPSLLLVDEPTANLDAEHAASIIDLFGSFHQAGVTVIIATHDDQVIRRLPLRQIHLEAGQLERPFPLSGRH